MNIYFAGGIRGGSGDPKLYAEIIKILNKLGNVVTSHLANPEVQQDKLKNMKDDAIYITDMNQLKASDLLVTEVSAPSIGIGYKIAKAESMGVPVMALFNNSSTFMLSALVAGNSHITIMRYNDLKDLEQKVTEHIKEKFSFFL